MTAIFVWPPSWKKVFFRMPPFLNFIRVGWRITMQSLLLLLKSAQFDYFVCLIRCTIKFWTYDETTKLEKKLRKILADLKKCWKSGPCLVFGCKMSANGESKAVEMETEKGFTSHSTQNRSFRRRSFQPNSWLGTEKTKAQLTGETTKPKWPKLRQKNTHKIETEPLQNTHKSNLTLIEYKFKNRSYLCAYRCAQLLYTTQRCDAVYYYSETIKGFVQRCSAFHLCLTLTENPIDEQFW